MFSRLGWGGKRVAQESGEFIVIGILYAEAVSSWGHDA